VIVSILINLTQAQLVLGRRSFPSRLIIVFWSVDVKKKLLDLGEILEIREGKPAGSY
jgi:hypothetical protein